MLLGLLSMACDPTHEPAALKVSPKQNRWENRTISEHQFSKATSTELKPIGAGCDEHGAKSCRDGTCMRVIPGAHICTRFCDSQADCPEDWSCLSPMPGRDVRVCVPKRLEVAP